MLKTMMLTNPRQIPQPTSLCLGHLNEQSTDNAPLLNKINSYCIITNSETSPLGGQYHKLEIKVPNSADKTI